MKFMQHSRVDAVSLLRTIQCYTHDSFGCSEMDSLIRHESTPGILTMEISNFVQHQQPAPGKALLVNAVITGNIELLVAHAANPVSAGIADGFIFLHGQSAAFGQGFG